MSSRLSIFINEWSNDKELVVDIIPEHGASHEKRERSWYILGVCQQVVNGVGPAILHDDLVEDRESVATTDFLVDDFITGPHLFLECQLEELLTISDERMTGKIVDRVADTVVDLERHFERWLEEEVSLVYNFSLIIDPATFLRI